jgi:hypothetical protein
VPNKISRNHNNFACPLLQHFKPDIVVFLVVFVVTAVGWRAAPDFVDHVLPFSGRP